MSTYAANNLDAYTPPNCPRCSKPAAFDWADITSFFDPVPMMTPARHWCETPNCVDENGHNTIFPTRPRLVGVWVENGAEVEIYVGGWCCRACGKRGEGMATGHIDSDHPRPTSWWRRLFPEAARIEHSKWIPTEGEQT